MHVHAHTCTCNDTHKYKLVLAGRGVAIYARMHLLSRDSNIKISQV